MGGDSSPPPDRISMRYKEEPQPFGNTDEDGPETETATIENVEDPKQMYSVLEKRQQAYVKAENHRLDSIAAKRPKDDTTEWMNKMALGEMGVPAQGTTLSTRNSGDYGSGNPVSSKAKPSSLDKRSSKILRPIDRESAGRARPERRDKRSSLLNQQPQTPVVEEPAAEIRGTELKEAGSEGASKDNLAVLGRTRGKTKDDQPAQTLQTAPPRATQMQWNKTLRIGLRMAYSDEFSSVWEDKVQRRADAWNKVFENEETILRRNAFVPGQTMYTQYIEHKRAGTTPSLREWREVMAIEPTDQCWVSMKEEFQKAIDELDRENGWRTELIKP
ncbi:hypothetical protein Slin14017_G063150 [Septoria linicola]|nr:hypothetical protein Slin14017_G063150 [Septoria linicola]